MSELISTAILAGLALWGIGFHRLYGVTPRKKQPPQGQLKVFPGPAHLRAQNGNHSTLEMLRNRRSS